MFCREFQFLVILISILLDNCRAVCPPIANRLPKNGIPGQCRGVRRTGIWCKIGCKPGYRLQGSPLRRCGLNVWRGYRAKCVPTNNQKSCPPIRMLKNGIVFNQCCNKFVVGCALTFICNNDFELDGKQFSQCLRGGKWSKDKPECKEKTTTTTTTKAPPKCPQLPAPQNGYWIDNNGLPQCNGNSGQRCRLICLRGVLVGGPDVYCNPITNEWSKPIPKCV